MYLVAQFLPRLEYLESFFVQTGDAKTSYKYDCPNNLGTSDLVMDSSYPYSVFFIKDDNGKILSEGKVALILPRLISDPWKFLGLEILYIGQSYGKDGSRNACDRLKSHSTLQGIYSEAISQSPDCDIWIVLCEFTGSLVCSFDGSSGEYITTEEDDIEHIKSVFGSKISEQQRINFTEAALIKYFQPPYNKQYRDTFPNSAHSTYSECYDIDLNMVCVELNTQNIHAMVYTENIEQKPVHFCEFPLHSREDRVYMFDTDYIKSS